MSVSYLTKSFKENKVLKEISFEVHPGEVLCILGSQRCRKNHNDKYPHCTVALGSDGGEITYKGSPIGRQLQAYKQSLDIVSQDLALESSGQRVAE